MGIENWHTVLICIMHTILEYSILKWTGGLNAVNLLLKNAVHEYDLYDLWFVAANDKNYLGVQSHKCNCAWVDAP